MYIPSHYKQNYFFYRLKLLVEKFVHYQFRTNYWYMYYLGFGIVFSLVSDVIITVGDSNLVFIKILSKFFKKNSLKLKTKKVLQWRHKNEGWGEEKKTPKEEMDNPSFLWRNKLIFFVFSKTMQRPKSKNKKSQRHTETYVKIPLN